MKMTSYHSEKIPLMMKDADDVEPINMLKEIPLEVVAAYLKCDPELLRKALRRLAKIGSAIEYGPDYQAVAITKAIALTAAELEDYLQDSGDEITELEALYSRQDDRSKPIK
jgi:hypothetical protein